MRPLRDSATAGNSKQPHPRLGLSGKTWHYWSPGGRVIHLGLRELAVGRRSGLWVRRKSNTLESPLFLPPGSSQCRPLARPNRKSVSQQEVCKRGKDQPPVIHSTVEGKQGLDEAKEQLASTHRVTAGTSVEITSSTTAQYTISKW